jgi:hypothetical protein
MSTLYCAICRARFEPDDDHYRVEVEHRTVDDPNTTDEYVFCMDCGLDEFPQWGEPA